MPIMYFYIGGVMLRKSVKILKVNHEALILETSIGMDYRFSIPKTIRSLIDPNDKVRIPIKKVDEVRERKRDTESIDSTLK